VSYWHRERDVAARESFATRMTDADSSKSLVTAGTRDAFFRVVYGFDNEQLLEVNNRTAHAAALSALVETTNAYRFYFGVYLRNVKDDHAKQENEDDPSNTVRNIALPKPKSGSR